MLQIRIRRKCIAFFLASCSIKTYQVAGNILQFGFRVFLDPVPCACAEFADLRGHTFLASVFGKLVQSMDGNEDYIIVLIDQLYHFLRCAVDRCPHQTSETPDAVIHMHNIIARLYGLQFFQ